MTTTPTEKVSLVQEHGVVETRRAFRHFSELLALTTDSADLWEDLQNGAGDLVVVDVRSRALYDAAHIPGAIHLPHRKINAETTAGFDGSKTYVVYCNGHYCNGSIKGAMRLSQLGFMTKDLLGGLTGWQKLEGFPVHSTGADPTSDDSVPRCGC